MADYLVSGSVVVYNKPEDARLTVKSIVENTDDGFRLFVIDNASADRIGPSIRSEFGDVGGKVEYIDLDENIGFGKGHNQVLGKTGSKYHFVINPDILINRDTISNMCAFMDSHPEVAIACPKVLNPDGSLQYIAKRRPGFLSLVYRRMPGNLLKGIEDRYLMKEMDQDSEFPVEFCTGCFFVIRSEIFEKMGGFDRDYFLYFEDRDITMKAKQYGEAYYVPSATVIHFWHRETANNSRRFMQQVKSMMIYFRKWGFRLF